MKNLPFTILLSLIILISCVEPTSPPPPTKQWFKGNLHTHSYWSDGDEFPEVIMDWYKTQGYDFIALSDHNTLAEGEKWIRVPSDSMYQAAFAQYLASYGDEWVEHKKDDEGIQVKLKTLAEYRGRFEKDGDFLIVQAEEITDSHEGKPLHLNASNLQEMIEPRGGNSVTEVLQNNIDAVNQQREATGIPMIPHINHPNFGYAIALEDMFPLRGEQFFEVYNGHPQVHNRGDSSHMSTEAMWDLININYLQDQKPIMYGLATDDSHHYHRTGSKWSNAGRGWIMVQADALNPASIITAMEAGAFYASTGVILKTVDLTNNTLSVEVEAASDINYSISFIGAKKGASRATELSKVEGNKASFELTEDILFVRAKILSSKKQENPVEDFVYEAAWTQPVTP